MTMNASSDKNIAERCLEKPVDLNFRVGANISYGNKALKTTEVA